MTALTALAVLLPAALLVAAAANPRRDEKGNRLPRSRRTLLGDLRALAL